MDRKQFGVLAAILGVFLFAYFVNFTSPDVQMAIHEAFYLLQWYVRCHTLACVVPAMFIAGAIAIGASVARHRVVSRSGAAPAARRAPARPAARRHECP